MTTGAGKRVIGANLSRLRLLDGPLGISWHHCAITSDFIAEVYAHRFVSTNYKNARHDISYVANELIENAVKFRKCGEIVIEAATDSEDFLLKVSNNIDVTTAVNFQSLLSEITKSDPAQLLIDRIESKADQDAMSGSGLGLLTLMSDYNARLAWVFSTRDDGGLVCVDIFTTLPIRCNANER